MRKQHAKKRVLPRVKSDRPPGHTQLLEGVDADIERANKLKQEVYKLVGGKPVDSV